MLERKDRLILSELQRDGRLTMQELAGRVGMSSSACWRRVKSLEESGVIDRYAVIANTRKAGFGLSSMVHVSLARHEQKDVDDFIREVRRHPEVLECFSTSGEADFHLRVVVEDIDAYNEFLDGLHFSHSRRVAGAIQYHSQGNQGRHSIAISPLKRCKRLYCSASLCGTLEFLKRNPNGKPNHSWPHLANTLPPCPTVVVLS